MEDGTQLRRAKREHTEPWRMRRRDTQGYAPRTGILTRNCFANVEHACRYRANLEPTIKPTLKAMSAAMEHNRRVQKQKPSLNPQNESRRNQIVSMARGDVNLAKMNLTINATSTSRCLDRRISLNIGSTMPWQASVLRTQ